MKEISRRLRKLEVSHAAQRNAHGLNPADVLRQRVCRRRAAETGRPYEELLRESETESQAFWENYDGDGTISDILLTRYRGRASVVRTQASVTTQ